MQKTFSIAALLTLTAVVAAIVSGVLASQKGKQTGPGIAVTLLPHREIDQSRTVLLPENIEGIVTGVTARVVTDALTSVLGDTVQNVEVTSWQVNRSDGSMVIHARWTDVTTGEARPYKLELTAHSDGTYVGEIIGMPGSHAKEGRKIAIKLGGHERDSEQH